MIYIALLLRMLMFPFLRYLFPLINQKAKQRVEFELRNHTSQQMLSHADIGFEISSEGELEQIMLPLLRVLESGQKVELIYCSPSVETQCLNLQKQYPESLRLYRYPILTYNPLSKLLNPRKWLTCKRLFLCRYDFFPELMLYGKNCEQFCLLSGTLINFEEKGKLQKIYLSACFKLFNQYVMVTQADKDKLIKNFNINENLVENFDFRILRILKRQANKGQVYSEKLPSSDILMNFLGQLSERQKIIFGSFWNNELPILKKCYETDDLNRQFFILPHKLDDRSLKQLKDEMAHLQLDFVVIDKNTQPEEIKKIISKSKSQRLVWILNVKGLLCEFYTEFKLAYVGGGFGVSIHSVLEPYLAGCYVVIGAKNHRSTELKLILENNPDRILSVPNMEDVSKSFYQKNIDNLSSMDSFIGHYSGHVDMLLTWLRLEENN